jgi:hypothetical protein
VPGKKSLERRSFRKSDNEDVKEHEMTGSVFTLPLPAIPIGFYVILFYFFLCAWTYEDNFAPI